MPHERNEPTFTRKSKKIVISAIAPVVFVAGCGGNLWFERQTANSIQEAGTTHVAVLAVAPWGSIEEKLKPQFCINSENAKNEAIPVSQQVLERFTSQLSLGIGSSLARNESGVVSNADLQNIINKCGEKITATNVDPFLRYQVATTLFQEVTLLNEYLNHVNFKESYNPYLVRMQVALLPKRRNLPYDAYTNISFYPRDLSAASTPNGDAPLYVVPIIATDNHEGSSTIRLVEAVNSVNFSLQGLLDNMSGGLGGGARVGKNKASGVVDLNALLTVARAANNTIRVRMGAMHQGASHFAMVPRTHNITFLLLVRRQEIKKIRAVTQTAFVDAETGEVLQGDPSRKREKLEEKVSKLIRKFNYVLECDCVRLKGEPKEEYRSLEFLRLLQLGQYGDVENCISKRTETKTNEGHAQPPNACRSKEDGPTTNVSFKELSSAEYERLTRLFTELLELEVESQTGKVDFDISHLDKVSLDKKRLGQKSCPPSTADQKPGVKK